VWYYEKNITAPELLDRILKAAQETKPSVTICEKPKAKIPHPKEYNWPKGRKIPGRKFNGEPIK